MKDRLEKCLSLVQAIVSYSLNLYSAQIYFWQPKTGVMRNGMQGHQNIKQISQVRFKGL